MSFVIIYIGKEKCCIWRWRKNKSNLTELMSSLEEAYREENAVKIATLFYEIGEKYLQDEKEEKALVYFERFDELVGCDDDLYEQFQDKDEQASERIAELSMKDSYAKEIKDGVTEKGKDLNKFQKMQWNLLTLARVNQLFVKFSELPGFEVFTEFEEMLDILVEGLCFGCEEAEKAILDDFLLDLEDDIETATMISSKSRVKIKNSADFEALDLVEDDFYTNMMLFLYRIVEFFEGEEEEEITLHFVTNALHIGYYIRTREEAMYEIEALAEEKNRIIADYELVKGDLEKEEFVERIEEYKQLFLP